MDREPVPANYREINIKELYFPNGKRARSLIIPSGTSASYILQKLDIQKPNAVFIIAGGTSDISDELNCLFSRGIAHAAISMNAIVIDGGTQAGVMKKVGQAIVEQRGEATILLGISPLGRVMYPGKPTAISSDNEVPLDPNHSHFVLVESNEWGGETQTMYELAATLSATCPSVAIVVNGGSITKDEVWHNVRQERPIIIIEGSGRLADDIAKFWREKPAAITDAKMSEIIARGDIHLFPVTGSPEELEKLIFHLLDKGS
jgi:SLOG in TRPM, prokaryote